MILDWLFGRRTVAVSVSVDEAAELLRRQHLLVDIREAFEFASDRVPGARSLPLSKLRKGAFELDSTRPWLVICRSGHRSSIATRMLAQQGLTVKNVDGGMQAWRRAGLPIETKQKRS